MPATGVNTFSKEERLCSRTLIDTLFNGGGSRSMAAFPLRMVYMQTRNGDDTGEKPGAQILVSVPKRCFKRAVKRNRVKRQVREAYRKNKQTLYDALQKGESASVALAFIWLDDKPWSTEDVEHKVGNLLQRLAEKLAKS